MAKKNSASGAGLKIPSRSALAERLRAMSGLKVLVLGDVGIDRYTIGAVERISPEAPVPIVRVEDEKLKLGLAANVADNLRALKSVPLLCGVVGRDRAGDDFRELLKKNRIDTAHMLVDPARRTVLKERIVSDSQQLLRVDYETVSPLKKAMESAFFAKAERALKQADAVILQDYAKGLLSPRFSQRFFLSAQRGEKHVAVDPHASTPVASYRGAFVLTPNRKEAEALAGVPLNEGSGLREAGHRILDATEAQHVVITLGKDGMALFERGVNDAELIPTYAREVFDVSGAGDTVISVLTLAVAAGSSMKEAAVLGNLAAGVVVGKRGTATVTPDEILAYADSVR